MSDTESWPSVYPWKRPGGVRSWYNNEEDTFGVKGMSPPQPQMKPELPVEAESEAEDIQGGAPAKRKRHLNAMRLPSYLYQPALTPVIQQPSPVSIPPPVAPSKTSTSELVIIICAAVLALISMIGVAVVGSVLSSRIRALESQLAVERIAGGWSTLPPAHRRL